MLSTTTAIVAFLSTPVLTAAILTLVMMAHGMVRLLELALESMPDVSDLLESMPTVVGYAPPVSSGWTSGPSPIVIDMTPVRVYAMDETSTTAVQPYVSRVTIQPTQANMARIVARQAWARAMVVSSTPESSELDAYARKIMTRLPGTRRDRLVHY